MYDATKLLPSGDVQPTMGMQKMSFAAVAENGEPVTLEEAKVHLRVSIFDEDPYIQSLITTARAMLEGRINRALVRQTVTHSFDRLWPGMRLPVAPFIGDLQVTYTDAAGDQATLEETGYVLTTSQPPQLYPARGQSFPTLTPWPGTVQMQYTAGYADAAAVPAPLKHWILLAVGTLYEHRASVLAGVSVAELPADFMKCLYQPFVVYA
jgi:uncharacterized phiE125 gp8 family phage protein